MSVFYKSIIMFLGSSVGLSLIYLLVYTTYVVKKTGKYMYFFWILFPIIPIIYFFSIKKSKKVWIIFILIMIFYIYFVSSLEPYIANRKITEIMIYYDNKQYTITQKEDSKLITDIKWEVYKRDFLRNIGGRIDNGSYIGELKIISRGSQLIFPNYPLDDILKIIERE